MQISAGKPRQNPEAHSRNEGENYTLVLLRFEVSDGRVVCYNFSFFVCSFLSRLVILRSIWMMETALVTFSLKTSLDCFLSDVMLFQDSTTMVLKFEGGNNFIR